MRTACIFVIGVCSVLSLAGCTGVELAVVGAASAGLKTGQEVSRSGKLTLAVMADAAQVTGAAQRACESLGLTVHEVEHRGTFSWVIRCSDRKRAMRVIIQERAAMLTEIEVNVGLFGPKSVAELILKRTVAELELTDAEPGE